MAANRLPCIAPLRLGSGIAPEKFDSGTSVTNQKSLFALTCCALLNTLLSVGALLCLRSTAAFTDATSPASAVLELTKAIAVATCELDGAACVSKLTPWYTFGTLPFAWAAAVIFATLNVPCASTSQRLSGVLDFQFEAITTSLTSLRGSKPVCEVNSSSLVSFTDKCESTY